MVKKEIIFVVGGLMSMSFLYGYLVAANHVFPFSFIQQAKQGYGRVATMLDWTRPWYYSHTKRVKRAVSYKPELIAPGLTLVSGMAAKSQVEARVIDQSGETIHRWDLNWFDLWPDATHIDPMYTPKSPPGGTVHGIVLLDNGDLVFNIENLGLLRVDLCGKVVWRLPRMTHHSVHRDEEGNFWVPSREVAHERRSELPGYKPYFLYYKILKVSDDGKVLQEWSVMDLLKATGFESVLYLTTAQKHVELDGDTLHMNDLEVFPNSLPSGVFAPGDVMVSLRNINTVVVFDKELKTVKHIFREPFVRQHDADFIDGDTITVFDNYSQTESASLPRSRIVKLSAKLSKKPEVVFEGSEAQPFFTAIMGKHQWLSNGNLLLTEAMAGRALEVSPNKEIVWDYVNIVADGITGLLDEAQRLPPKFDKAFFVERSRRCPIGAAATLS